MLARIAHELFWLGRDFSRAEHTARMLDGALHAEIAGMAGEHPTALSWDAVSAIIGAKPPGPGEDEAENPDPPAALAAYATGTEVSRGLTLDSGNPASIVACVNRARERGRTLREVISTEMWEALNSFHLELAREETEPISSSYSFYEMAKQRCALFWGLVARTMLRDEGRAFLQAGARIEEADMVLRLLRVAIAPDPASANEGEALALLHAVGGLQAYRRAVRQAPTVQGVIRFLLYESAYPGAVASSILALRTALLTADARPRSSPPVLRLGRMTADMELQRRTLAGEAMNATLSAVAAELERVDRDIAERYFAVAALAAVHL